MAFNQLYRRNDNCIHQPSKGPVFDAVDETQLSLPPHFFIKLIGGENNCIDDGDCQHGIVHAAEEMHSSLILNNIFERAHHSQGVVHLHANFESVEDVPRYAVAEARDAATDHVLKKVRHCLLVQLCKIPIN